MLWVSDIQFADRGDYVIKNTAIGTTVIGRTKSLWLKGWGYCGHCQLINP
jgi:hypothetical protein